MQLPAIKLSTITPWFHAKQNKSDEVHVAQPCTRIHQLIMQASSISYTQASTHATSRKPTARTIHKST